MDPNTSMFTGPLAAVQLASAARVLTYSLPKLVATKFGNQQGVTSNTGDQIKFTWFEYFPVTGVPSVEGVTPASVPIVRRNVTLQLQQFVCWTPITDWVTDLHPDNILTVAERNLATWMAQTSELVTCNTIQGGTVVLYANGTSRTTVLQTITRPMCARAKEILNLNDAQELTEMVSPNTKVSTVGIPESFIALIHPSLEDDVRHCVGFKKTVEYGNPSAAMESEIGSVESIRFLKTRFLKPFAAASTNATTVLFRSNGADTNTAVGGSAGYADVHSVIFLAKNAYGCAKLNNIDGVKSGKTMSVILRRPNTNPTDTDPAAQRGSAAIKFYFGCVILSDLYMVRGEVCATNPSNIAW
jgi:N4-gp56 family major capsid protein